MIRRRFVEALRRAEILSVLGSADDEQELGYGLAEELCEAYEAEIGLVVERPAPDAGWEILGAVGVSEDARGVMVTSKELSHAAASRRAVTEQGSDLLGCGAKSSLLAGYRSADGREVVIGAARTYPSRFEEPEVALLEAVAHSTGQALERLWAHAERDRLIGELKEAFVGTAEALANALEAKDNYTADHATEVTSLAVELGAELGLSEGELEDLRYGAIFHDIGKIAIPDAILHKPGPLTAAERAVMMTHPEIGARIVAPIPFLRDAVKEMVRHDHERFDGGGYPDGLSGQRIPLGARIILVVDSFHAMISDRPYRKAMRREDALAELARHSGSQFDPNVVSAFIRVIG